MKSIRFVVFVCLAFSVAACGGGHLSIDLPRGEGGTLNLDFPPGEAVEHRLSVQISGGFRPYELTIDGCPDWVTLYPDQRILAGTGPAADGGTTFFCTFRVTESDPGFRPARSVSYGLRLTVPVKQPLELPMEILDILDESMEKSGRVDVHDVETGGNRHKQLTFKIGRFGGIPFPAASGGVEPYTYELVDCVLPAGLEFHPNTRVLSGIPNAEYRGSNCTYRVTDSSSASVSRSFVLVVDPVENSAWRFRTRTVEPGGPCVLPGTGPIQVATFPRAHGGEGTAAYRLPGAPPPGIPGFLLSFDPNSRVLTFANPSPPPIRGTPNTYRYLVEAGPNEHDALCLDVQYDPGVDVCPGDDSVEPPLIPHQYIHVLLRLRDDAFWEPNANWDPNANDGLGGYLGEYRCPDTTAPLPRPPIAEGVSNPVHEALGPVHARRATEVAHAAVRDRVRRWSPGSEQASFAVTPEVGLASLSGQHEGFAYTGNSESVTFGAESGAGAWQAGLVASFTGTDLHYRAAASLSERGYRTGEHDTEILSLHPFAAWHLPSGGHLWASLGGGIGRLRHRDDLGFPSWSGSDVRLLAHAAGASVPLADVLSGELQAEAGIESFAFDIEGGGRISSSLPAMRGLDYRAGLAWSAPVPGAPSVSVAYKHLTGDGPGGGQLEARGSVSVEGIFHPRVTLIGNAEGSLGLGGDEQNFWRLGGSVRFVPDSLGRGLGLELDTRLLSLDDGGSSGVGIRSEVGYGLWGGPFFRTMRPYVGLMRDSDDDSIRRTLGLDLGDTSDWRIKVEVLDHSSDRSPALRFSVRHRF
ncbi:MAG: putative Ig domain-containing protein [Deltaproteobacteria bacterium]|nr:putative Ig domain-containing protein [Deltaproteobacteria bacterium]